MKKVIGNLRKLTTTHRDPVGYSLDLGDERILLNDLLGQRLGLRFTGRIFCIQCERKTNKSFQQGYCYPCMLRLAECNYCIIHPEKCNVVHGQCPENDWAHAHCSQAHIVYLANSSGLKVGITRESQTPTRWFDQGAVQALPIFKVGNRYQSGLIEVCLKQFVNDRTDWRKMLKSSADPIDLPRERDVLLDKAHSALEIIISQFSAEIQRIQSDEVFSWQYPIQVYPQKITALSFDKENLIAGILQGIKGQYLIFDTGVINIRKFSGYEIELSW